MARVATLAARWLHEPQPINNPPVWLRFPHRAGRYRPEDLRFPHPVFEVVEIWNDLLYVLRIVMLLLFSATLGGGLHWRDARAAAPVAASRLLSY